MTVPAPAPAVVARTLVRAAHPGPTLAVTAIATALAVAVGRGPSGVLLVALTVLSGQLSIGWCNDLVDRDRDRASARADKPLATGALPPAAVAWACAVTSMACIPLSLANGVAAGIAHLVLVASGWAYNLGVKRTLASPLPYAVSFGLLPAVVTLGLPGSPWPPLWAILGGSLLGVGAHGVNVLPDFDDDLATGVRGLPQRLGRRTTRMAAAAVLLIASVVLAVGPGRVDAVAVGGLLAVGLALGAGVAAPGPARSRAPFTVAVVVALVDVALLLARGGALT